MASRTLAAGDPLFSPSAVRAARTLVRTRERTVRLRCRRRSLWRMSFMADFVFANSVSLSGSSRFRAHRAPVRAMSGRPFASGPGDWS
jgi:hypothetical protein